MPEKPDLVVSGVNDGANASTNVLYSGTVAAAAEGAFAGILSFAVSLQRGGGPRFDAAANIGLQLIEFICRQHVSVAQLININIPPLNNGSPKGIRIARQGDARVLERFLPVESPEGRAGYQLTGDIDAVEDAEDSDLRALQQGYVTVTPLQFDLTHFEQLQQMQDWSWPEINREKSP
jgi:5'-nucleotidase